MARRREGIKRKATTESGGCRKGRSIDSEASLSENRLVVFLRAEVSATKSTNINRRPERTTIPIRPLGLSDGRVTALIFPTRVVVRSGPCNGRQLTDTHLKLTCRHDGSLVNTAHVGPVLIPVVVIYSRYVRNACSHPSLGTLASSLVCNLAHRPLLLLPLSNLRPWWAFL